MDSLRYWVEDCHVDGFRFDLATSLGREYEQFGSNAVFFDAVRQDPVLARVKLIAEPWDVGEDGYQVGNFPPGWAEWNGRFRDDMRTLLEGRRGPARRPWRAICSARPTSSSIRAGDPGPASISSPLMTGSRSPTSFSYNRKHNEANGEDNRDGHDDNRSWNCGVEGPTDDPAILDLRDRMRRNIMTTLLFSQGTPMLLMGDEVGRTQNGNNNAYCQDNEISWLDWKDIARPRPRLHGVPARPHPHPAALFAAALRKFPARAGDRRRRHRNVVWFRPDGAEMDAGSWSRSERQGGRPAAQRPEDALLLFTNSYHQPTLQAAARRTSPRSGSCASIPRAA